MFPVPIAGLFPLSRLDPNWYGIGIQSVPGARLTEMGLSPGPAVTVRPSRVYCDEVQLKHQPQEPLWLQHLTAVAAMTILKIGMDRFSAVPLNAYSTQGRARVCHLSSNHRTEALL